MIQHYGVLLQNSINSEIDRIAEEIALCGFSVVESQLDSASVRNLCSISDDLFSTKVNDEDDQIFRAPGLTEPAFLTHAAMSLMIQVAERLIPGRVVLNQQNLVANPGQGSNFSQARFHRDLPYQHFTSSRPLGVNVLLTLDSFTSDNGGTIVVPGTHKAEDFPSDTFIEKHQVQVCAPAGSLIFLDAMLYHSAGANGSKSVRRAVNHVFTSPLIAQQIEMSGRPEAASLAATHPELYLLLGLDKPHREPSATRPG